VVLHATAVAHAPRGTPHEHAATIPLAGLTADEALVGELGATDFVARTDALGQSVRNLAPSGVDAVIDTAVIGIVAHEALRGGGTFVALVAPLAEAANAHRLVERGGQRGRIVLRA
jgi:hypothetical protein